VPIVLDVACPVKTRRQMMRDEEKNQWEVPERWKGDSPQQEMTTADCW
jgi:hypothetical protein